MARAERSAARAAPPATGTPRSPSPVGRVVLAVQLSLFAAELIIGIVVNLYLKVPDVHPGSASAAPGPGYFGDLLAVLAWALSAGPFALTLHVALGLALIVLGFVLIPLARGSGATAITLITLAALFTLGAALNGGSFLIFGNDDSLSSLIMESLFTAAATCYVITLVRGTRSPASPAAGEPTASGDLAGRDGRR